MWFVHGFGVRVTSINQHIWACLLLQENNSKCGRICTQSRGVFLRTDSHNNNIIFPIMSQHLSDDRLWLDRQTCAAAAWSHAGASGRCDKSISGFSNGRKINNNSVHLSTDELQALLCLYSSSMLSFFCGVMSAQEECQLLMKSEVLQYVDAISYQIKHPTISI